MNHLCSTAWLLTRLDEPEPFVDASCDLGEEVSRIGVSRFDSLLAGVACMSKERRSPMFTIINLAASLFTVTLALPDQVLPTRR
ncbi:MAG TPA: hypothetical protein VF844_17210 [Ktedonobacteraceae bacterium]